MAHQQDMAMEAIRPAYLPVTRAEDLIVEGMAERPDGMHFAGRWTTTIGTDETGKFGLERVYVPGAVDEPLQPVDTVPVAEEVSFALSDSHVERRKPGRARAALGGLIAATSLVLVSCSSQSFPAKKATTTTEVTTTVPGAETVISDEERVKNFEEDLGKIFQGFNPGEIAAGTAVDFGKNPQERGSAAFSDHTLESREQIADFLASDDERAKVLRDRIAQALADRPEELARALSGEGYVAVQTLVPISIEGTTYFVDGQMVQMDSARSADSGDVQWLFVDEKGNIDPDASLRADCSNAHLTRVTPVRPGQPIPPSIGYPPKFDRNTTPAGVPGQNGGSGTEPAGPRGPGRGPAGQTPGPDGVVPGEVTPTAPAEEATPTDPNSHTGPVDPGDAEIGTPPTVTVPAAPPTSVPTNGGQGGHVGEGSV